MMWLTSPVTLFLMDVSQGTSPKFSKGWCVRELMNLEFNNAKFHKSLYAEMLKLVRPNMWVYKIGPLKLCPVC